MIGYYDPLYRHTLPERRLEVLVDDEEAGLVRLKTAIGQVLGEVPGVEQPVDAGP